MAKFPYLLCACTVLGALAWSPTQSHAGYRDLSSELDNAERELERLKQEQRQEQEQLRREEQRLEEMRQEKQRMENYLIRERGYER